jgi:hypothetical protein
LSPALLTIGTNSIQFAGIGAPIHFFAGVKSVEVLLSGGGHITFQAAAALLSATASPDTHLTALDAILAEWSVTDDPTNLGE